MSTNSPSARHWDTIYAAGSDTRSWCQATPDPSLRMLDAAGVSPDDSLIDVGAGAGASTLVDALLDRDYRDITMLDISATGLDAARVRLGPRASRAHWLTTDLLVWTPARTYRVWHDRAVLHFLTDAPARQRNLNALGSAARIGDRLGQAA